MSDSKHQQFGAWTARKRSTYAGPSVRTAQLFAGEILGSVEGILQYKMECTRAFNRRFEPSREFVSGGGLNRNKLVNSEIGEAAAINDRRETWRPSKRSC